MPRLVRSIASIALLLTTFVPIALAAKPATVTPAARFAEYGLAGTFLLQRDGARSQTLHNDASAAKPLRPASTFKVLLALIALETGALRSADEVVKWNGTPYPDRPQWQKDLALREAMQNSSESYFGVLATRIGRERLEQWVVRTGYGNGRIGPNPPRVWHDGVLTVSAQQQLDFVDRLRRGALPFSAKTIAAVKTSMLHSETKGRRMYGKTGTHVTDDGTGHGWWIGWVEGGNTPAASFVLGIELKTMDQLAKRTALGERLLRDAGVLPAK